MKLFLYFSVFILLLKICSSAISRNNNALHEDHPGKCYHESTKHAFGPGEIYKPIGICMQFNCVKVGAYTGYSCGAASMPECENLGKDLTKPYPHCCDRFLCRNENGTDFISNPHVPSKSYKKEEDEENDL